MTQSAIGFASGIETGTGALNNLSGMFQDYITLNGLISPGAAEITQVSIPRKWDVRGAYGISGAPIVYTGDENAKITVELRHWMPPDLDVKWQLFANMLSLRPIGIAPESLASYALEIRHPLLNATPINISSVVVEECSPWKQDDDGVWSMTIKFIQFVTPKPGLGKPNKTIPGTEIQDESARARNRAQLNQGTAEVAMSDAALEMIQATGPGR